MDYVKLEWRIEIKDLPRLQIPSEPKYALILDVYYARIAGRKTTGTAEQKCCMPNRQLFVKKGKINLKDLAENVK